MTVSNLIFNSILLVMALISIAIPSYLRFVKKKGGKYDLLFLLVFLVLPIYWFTPKIITVTDCNQYKKEVVLFPTTIKDTIDITYGIKTYVFNVSKEYLYFDYICYGNAKKEEDEEYHIIYPNKFIKENTSGIEYVFETPPESLTTKSGGKKISVLYCGENKYISNE